MSSDAASATRVLPSAPPTRLADPLNTTAAAWTRAFFSHPSRVAATLELTGAAAIASVLPLRHWPPAARMVLLGVIAAAALLAGLRATVGSRLPRWSLQVDVALGTIFVTGASAASAREHVGLANLYLLVVLFAVLYLPLRSALVHAAAAGVAFGVVLALSPPPGEVPALAWLAVFATAAVLGAVVLGLVSVLRVAAQEDPLTGLPNRRSWDERLGEELERARRAGTALSVAMADLDGFKQVNDRLGHDAGNLLLQDLARSWRIVIGGGGDFLARLGGDEFGLLAPGSDEIAVRQLTRRLADTLPAAVTASIGVATWNGTESASDLLRRADQAMYEAKRRRRRDKELRPS